jgi:16S rRNA (guanine527-N7)-methyltransferase
MFHVKHEDRTSDARLAPSARERLRAYEALLRERAVAAGMIAASDRSRIWERHILDSLRGAPLVPTGRVADLGSGAGLPGIPIAIARPDLIVTLFESRRHRAGLLELFVERLELSSVRVSASRLEDVHETFDATLARALAAPTRTWALAEPLLARDAPLLYWAGPDDDRWASGVRIDLHAASDLANSGPIAIMTRQ